MKTVKFIVTAMIAVFIGANSYAQKNDHCKHSGTAKSEASCADKSDKTGAAKTTALKVSGNCDMCKSTIEKAAKVEGVSKAEWNKDKKLLTLVYNPAKVNSDSVLKKVAAAGYDNEKFKADNKVYSNLPTCCQYKR